MARNFFKTLTLSLFFSVIAHASLAYGEDVRCEIVFAGPMATVSAQSQGLAAAPNLLFGFGGYVQCRSPQVLGWASFADRNASDRHLMLMVNSDNARANPEAAALAEQRVKDCYRLGLIAMSNPARYLLNISIYGGSLSAVPVPNELSLAVYVEAAETIACSLNVNSTGLR